jgi:hypothetical protein
VSLIQKLRQARQTWATVGRFGFLIQRPTALEGAELAGASPVEKLRACVVNWRGITEQDLVPGGAADPVPFDSDLFAEWVSDQPEILTGITEAITAAILAHQARRQALEKN